MACSVRVARLGFGRGFVPCSCGVCQFRSTADCPRGESFGRHDDCALRRRRAGDQPRWFVHRVRVRRVLVALGGEPFEFLLPLRRFEKNNVPSRIGRLQFAAGGYQTGSRRPGGRPRFDPSLFEQIARRSQNRKPVPGQLFETSAGASESLTSVPRRWRTSGCRRVWSQIDHSVGRDERRASSTGSVAGGRGGQFVETDEMHTRLADGDFTGAMASLIFRPRTMMYCVRGARSGVIQRCRLDVRH